MYNENENDHLTYMNTNVEDLFVDSPDELTKIVRRSREPIYLGSNITKLSFLIRVYNLKARNRWSDNGFFQLVSFLGDIFPQDNNIPNSM